MNKASHFGLVIACIFILLSTSILISIRSFSTPMDIKVISDSSWHDPTGVSDGTPTGSIEEFSV
jgi:hypothetical protein